METGGLKGKNYGFALCRNSSFKPDFLTEISKDARPVFRL